MTGFGIGMAWTSLLFGVDGEFSSVNFATGLIGMLLITVGYFRRAAAS